MMAAVVSMLRALVRISVNNDIIITSVAYLQAFMRNGIERELHNECSHQQQ